MAASEGKRRKWDLVFFLFLFYKYFCKISSSSSSKVCSRGVGREWKARVGDWCGLEGRVAPKEGFQSVVVGYGLARIVVCKGFLCNFRRRES